MSVILLTTGIVSLIVCLSFLSYEMFVFRRDTIEKWTTLSQIIAYNTSFSLAFDNEADAAQILSSLKKEPNISSAVLYKTNGEFFASYFQSGAINTNIHSPLTTRNINHSFTSSKFYLYQEVKEGEKNLGTLYLECNLTEVIDRAKLYSMIVASAMFISLIISFSISYTLQKNISFPILYLTDIAKKLMDSKNYSMRAEKFTNDEIGILTDSFNQMLDYIRDSQLAKEDELKKLVDERTKELQASNKELESFSYSVSHDLRAPLRGIAGYSQVLMDNFKDKMGPDGERMVNTIRTETVRMGQLIDELLNFSRLNKQPIKMIPLDMAKLCNFVFKELIRPYPQRKIQLIVNQLPESLGDETLIRQVWTNLLSNAIKFTKNKEETVIEVGCDNNPMADMNTYYIKDNGIGFDMKYYNKLFGVFQRLHPQNEFEGTGIGLALIQRIIQRHSGRVWAEGKVNEGATFYFTLLKTNVGAPSIITP